MTYLAYDPVALLTLRRRTLICIDELFAVRPEGTHGTHGTHGTDETDTAMRVVRVVRDHLTEELLPVLRRVLTADALARPADDRLDLPAPSNSLARWAAVERGWWVGPDPTPDQPGTMTGEEADALAWRLAQLRVDDVLGDTERLHWLTGELADLAAHPALARRFTEQFTGWAEWATVMGRHRANEASAFDETGLSVADLDALIDRFAAVARHAAMPTDSNGRTRDPFVTMPWLGQVPPYAAALWLRGLQLPDEMAATVAARLATAPGNDGTDQMYGPNTVDVLLTAMLPRPHALASFFVRTAGQFEVWFRVDDASLTGAALVAATDPATVDTATAGRIVPAALDWYAAHPDDATPQVIGGLVAPWTVQFSPGNHQWEVPASRRSELIAAALRDDGVLAWFIARQDLVIDGAMRTFGDGRIHPDAEVQGYVEMIGGLVVNERVRRTEHRRAAWFMTATLIGIAAAALPGVGLGISTGIATAVVPAVFAPDPKDTRREHLRGADLAVTELAATVARDVYDEWMRRGYVSSATLDPPPAVDLTTEDVYSAVWMGHFLDWLDTMPDGGTWTGFYTSHVALRVFAVLNVGQMTDHVLAWVDAGPTG